MSDDLKKQLKDLAMQKIDQLLYLSSYDIHIKCRPVILEFADLFLEDENVFEYLMDAYRHQLASLDLYSRDIDISYKKEQHIHTITFLDKQFSLEEASYVDLLSDSIEIMREVLPLGTVVELDPDYFKPDPSNHAPIKVVITGRFLAPQNYHSYFPYEGVVYPFGEIKKDAVIHFTHPLINRVVHLGYQDEMEEAFELLMKKEMILDKGMKSIEFSNADMKRLQRDFAEEQEVIQS